MVVMYHDQGHIPTKLIGFRYDQATGQWGNVAGVNVTLGLPIIRTSVDPLHTAFEIAGEAKANPESMIDAIQLAARAGQRQKHLEDARRPTKLINCSYWGLLKAN